MRLAGTANQYSTSAIPQLAITATHIAACGNLRWPYQATVIKTLEPISRRIGSTAGDIRFMDGLDSEGLANCLTGEPVAILVPCWFPGPVRARGSKGNTVRRTHQGPNPWLPPQL